MMLNKNKYIMTNDNKNRIECGLEILALAVWAFATIVTCAAVWNYCTELFPCIVSGILLVTNGFAIYRKMRAVRKTFRSFINKNNS